MNREIKFRGLDINGNWIYGDLITDGKDSPNPDLAYIFPVDADEYNFELAIRVSRKTVNQYTGLKDKNGKEIYEGDVLKDKKGKLCVVDYTTFMNSTDYGDFYSGVGFEFGENMRPEECVVIGNIYENYELLKQKI